MNIVREITCVADCQKKTKKLRIPDSGSKYDAECGVFDFDARLSFLHSVPNRNCQVPKDGWATWIA